MLKHQMLIHSDLHSQLDLIKPVTPYEHRPGFSWVVCPVMVAGEQSWLLINMEFGFCELVEGITADDIEQSVLDVIELHLPHGRDEDNISVSFDPDHISWHTTDKLPDHAAQRYELVRKRLAKCKDLYMAEEAIDKLNLTPLTLHGRKFAPVDGLSGLLLELADKFRHYIETAPWWKLQWHLITRKTTPWLD